MTDMTILGPSPSPERILGKIMCYKKIQIGSFGPRKISHDYFNGMGYNAIKKVADFNNVGKIDVFVRKGEHDDLLSMGFGDKVFDFGRVLRYNKHDNSFDVKITKDIYISYYDFFDYRRTKLNPITHLTFQKIKNDDGEGYVLDSRYKKDPFEFHYDDFDDFFPDDFLEMEDEKQMSYVCTHGLHDIFIDMIPYRVSGETVYNFYRLTKQDHITECDAEFKSWKASKLSEKNKDLPDGDIIPEIVENLWVLWRLNRDWKDHARKMKEEEAFKEPSAPFIRVDEGWNIKRYFEFFESNKDLHIENELKNA